MRYNHRGEAQLLSSHPAIELIRPEHDVGGKKDEAGMVAEPRVRWL